MFSRKDESGDSEVLELVETNQYETLIAKLWEEGLMAEITAALTNDIMSIEGQSRVLLEDFLIALKDYVKLAVVDKKVAKRLKIAINDELWYNPNDERIFIGNPNAGHKPPRAGI